MLPECPFPRSGWPENAFGCAGRVSVLPQTIPLPKCRMNSEPRAISHAVDYAKFRSRSHDAVIRVYYSGGNLIRVHEEGPLQPGYSCSTGKTGSGKIGQQFRASGRQHV
jgi:hypothetical protein